jgi:hypothetical protein
VDIVAVPDEDHVVVRLESGSELTLAFDAIRDAILIDDSELFSNRGRG